MIHNFVRHLKFERVERNIRGMFLRTRIRLRLRSIQAKSLGRFFMLVVHFRRYVKRFREKAFTENRKTAVNSVLKGVMK